MAGYEPVGVVGQIIPWNFPLLMLVSLALFIHRAPSLPRSLTKRRALCFDLVPHRPGK
jgi:aldehyde dehydrogenase (NAD+)